jgi:hypothetical protein
MNKEVSVTISLVRKILNSRGDYSENIVFKVIFKV